MLTKGIETSEYKLTLRAGAILAAVFIVGKGLEALIYITTGVQQVVISDVEFGVIAAALSGGAGLYTYGRGSVKKAAVAVDEKTLANFADKVASKLVEAARK